MKTKIKQLMIAIDLSSSMKDIKFSIGQSRLDWVLTKLKIALAEVRSEVIIELYIFHDDLISIGKYDSVSSALNEIDGISKRPAGGSTKLWNALTKLIESIPENEPQEIICATDGDDIGSVYTRQSVEEL